MASVVNRSPFLVVPRSKAASDKTRKFRSRSGADEYRAELEAAGVPATVRQEDEGSWEAVVRMLDGAGKRHEGRRRFHTEAQARAWADDEERKILALRASSAPISAAKTKFGDAVDAWYEAKGRHLAGAKVIAGNVKAVKARIGEDKPLDEITVAVVRKFRDGMLSDGYAPSTIGNHRQILSGTLRYWISERDFPGANVCRSVDWPPQELASEPPRLSEDELAELLKVIAKRSPWLVPHVEWATECATRRGEMMDMTWEDVDLERLELRIVKEKNDHAKKRTEAKGRVLPLWPALVAILERIQPDPAKRVGKVFEGTRNSVSHAFTECVKGSKFAHLTFHSTRKVATGRLSEALPNVVELARVSGHRDIRTLANVYYGTKPGDLREKIAKAAEASQRPEDPLAPLLEQVARIAAEGGSDAIEKAERLLSRIEALRAEMSGTPAG